MITRMKSASLIATVGPFALAITAVTVTAQGRGGQPRATGPMTGTASLSGVVITDDLDGRPIRRAAVSLGVPGDSRRQWVTSTDDNGRFAFAGLPSGNFTLFAAKPGYVRAYYGAKRPGSTLAVPIAVVDSRAAESVTLKMARGAVITGTVFDDRGRPMSGVPVRARRVVKDPNGTRSFGPVTGGAVSAGTTSDDRGVYRIYGLPPDEYVVSATPVLVRAAVIAGSDGIDLRAPTAAELQWADRQLQPTAAPAPATPPAPSRPMAYSAVFHPNAVDPMAATIINLAIGQERSGVDLTMRFVPTAQISGVVLDRAGQPAPNVAVTLASRGDGITEPEREVLVGAGLLAPGPSARTGADGAFSIRGVQPGEYTLTARGVDSSAPPVQTFATSDLDVGGRDVDGVTLNLSPALSLSGRIVFEGATTPPAGVRYSVRVTPIAGAPAPAGGPLPIVPGSTFAVSSLLPGRYRLIVTVTGSAANAPMSWGLKSATLGGRDIADAPFEIRQGEDLSTAILTFSEALASVTGVVHDAAGRPSSDLSLLMFTTDRAQWFQNSRRIRAPIRAASDGRFAFTGLPAGEYFLAAVGDFEPNAWFSPEFLDQLAAGAIKITVADGEKKTQDVKIGR